MRPWVCCLCCCVLHAVSRGQGHGLALTLARGTAADADVVAPSYKHHKGEDHETGTVHDTHGGGYVVYRGRDVERADAGAGGDGGNGRGRRGATGRVRSCAIARCACP